MSGTISGGTWTYSGTPDADDKDAVRFLISDTDIADQRFSDEEILWTITQQGTVAGAARALRLQLAQGVSRAAQSKWVGDLKIDYDTNRVANLLRLADELQEGSSHNPRLVSGYAGGISVSRKQVVASDTDRTRPGFYRGMLDDAKVPGDLDAQVST